MHILNASAAYAPFVGGAQTYQRVISEQLVRDGHAVCVVTSDASEVESFWNPRKPRIAERTSTINGVKVLRARVEHLPLSPLSFYGLRRLTVMLAGVSGTDLLLKRLALYMPWIPQYEKLLHRLPDQFDLVHGVNIALEWPVIAAWRFARAQSWPFVVTPFVHVGEPNSNYVSRNYTMPHQLQLIRDADAVIVQTNIERERLLKFGVDSARMHVLGVGVDLPSVQGGDAGQFRSDFGIAGPVVLFLGVITKDKGIIHLIEAMRRLWSEGNDAMLVIVGKPVAEFESYWRTLPISVTQQILRTGLVDEQVKKHVLAAATVLVMPSRIDSFGIVFLEAWANGVPVIGARAGGIPGVITENQDGLLVDYGDVPALAAAIGKLLSDAAYRKELGCAGLAKVLNRFSWDHIYQRSLRIYAQAIESFQRGTHHA